MAEGSIDSVSVDIDSACDKWSERLAYASAFARCLAQDKERNQVIPDDMPAIAYVLLIDMWHEGKFGVN